MSHNDDHDVDHEPDHDHDHDDHDSGVMVMKNLTAAALMMTMRVATPTADARFRSFFRSHKYRTRPKIIRIVSKTTLGAAACAACEARPELAGAGSERPLRRGVGGGADESGGRLPRRARACRAGRRLRRRGARGGGVYRAM